MLYLTTKKVTLAVVPYSCCALCCYFIWHGIRNANHETSVTHSDKNWKKEKTISFSSSRKRRSLCLKHATIITSNSNSRSSSSKLFVCFWAFFLHGRMKNREVHTLHAHDMRFLQQNCKFDKLPLKNFDGFTVKDQSQVTAATKQQHQENFCVRKREREEWWKKTSKCNVTLL